jgi:carbon-monoxide dehydrogenase medium subunit
MYAAEFDYASPTSLDSAISMLTRHGDDAKVIAGGQSLVPMMNLRLLQPGLLIDINGLPMAEVRIDGDWLVIPAGTRHQRLTRDPLVERHAPMLVECARHIGNVRVRTRGTIGGSVAALHAHRARGAHRCRGAGGPADDRGR